MKLTTYAGLGLLCAFFIMRRYDYVGWGVVILGVSLCIPEIVERFKKRHH